MNHKIDSFIKTIGSVPIRFNIFALILFMSSMTMADNSPMELVYNTNLSDGTTITLPLNGNVDVTIDWGDGNSDKVTAVGDVAHTYGSEGSYTVKIQGTLTHFGRTTGFAAGVDKLERVNSFGEIGLTSLVYAFAGAKNLVFVPDSLPKQSLITELSSAFLAASSLKGGVSSWDVSTVVNMSQMFGGAEQFSEDLSSWIVDSVKNMNSMFYSATAFNGDLSTWNVSSVVDMTNMFAAATAFNGNISSWDVGSVTDMIGMFSGATSFNGDLSTWDVSNVIRMDDMFKDATSFAGDLSSWKTTSTRDMSGMFQNATSFDNDLSSWNISKVMDMTDVFSGATLSIENYNNLLNGWSKQILITDLSFNGGNSQFSTIGQVGRDSLMGTKHRWTISDGGMITAPVALDTTLATGENLVYAFAKNNFAFIGVDPADELTKIKITSLETVGNLKFKGVDVILDQEIAIADIGQLTYTPRPDESGLDYDSFQIKVSTTGVFSNNSAKISIEVRKPMVLVYNTALSAGTTIELPISDDINAEVHWGDGSVDIITRANFSTSRKHTYSNDQIYTVKIYGYLNRFGFGHEYNEADKLQAVKSFGEIGLTSLFGAFWGAKNLIEVPSTLPKESTITDMRQMFYQASSFNGDVSSWDVSKVSSMFGMFTRATSFSGDVSSWDVSSVTNMSLMFSRASSFTSDLSSWDVSKVLSMDHMFNFAESFTSDLSSWDVSNVKEFGNMFCSATSFTSDLSSWNVSNARATTEMFKDATSFSSDLSNWNISSIEFMTDMFSGLTMSPQMYDKLLNSWSAQTVKFGVPFTGGNSKYSGKGEVGRRVLKSNLNKWSIWDGGKITVPVANDTTIVINEDSSYILKKADFNFYGIEENDTLNKVQITKIATEGSLKLNGIKVDADQEIRTIDFLNLTYTPEKDSSGVAYDSITFKVSDGSVYSDNSFTITFDVIAIADTTTKDISEFITTIFLKKDSIDVSRKLIGTKGSEDTVVTTMKIDVKIDTTWSIVDSLVEGVWFARDTIFVKDSIYDIVNDTKKDTIPNKSVGIVNSSQFSTSLHFIQLESRRFSFVIPPKFSGVWHVQVYGVLGDLIYDSRFSTKAGSTNTWDFQLSDLISDGRYYFQAVYFDLRGRQKKFQQLINLK